MSSSVHARASSGSQPGSVLFAENKLTTAASTKTTTPPTPPLPSQPRCLSYGARRRGPESPSSFVFFEKVAAARVKKRARIEDEEDFADSCDKASASHENKDDGGRDSCPRAPPSKKKRAALSAAVSATAFAKKRAGIADDYDDDRVADPGDNDDSDDDCCACPRQEKRAPLAVGFPVKETEKKTAKQTGARGPLFARWAEAVRRDKFSCRRSECGAGASLLSPVAVCLEEPDVSDLRSSLEASQISKAEVASSAAVASAAETKAAASNE